MYAPSIAMTALTPLPWWGSILLLGISSTTYTALGGLKAIVWTVSSSSIFHKKCETPVAYDQCHTVNQGLLVTNQVQKALRTILQGNYS